MKLPIHQQILLAPGFILGILSLLVWYTLNQHFHFQRQNENINTWTYFSDQFQIAENASEKLRGILLDLLHGGVDDIENHHLAYLEQYGILQKIIACTACMATLTEKNQRFLRDKVLILRYQDNLDIEIRLPELNALVPRLNHINKSLLEQKSQAYQDYYVSMGQAGPKLIWISIATLLLCIVGGGILIFATWRSLNTRLGRLTEYAQRVCAGEFVERKVPTNLRDDLDKLEYCIFEMTKQLLEVISVTKVVEATEDERKRIAMEMHDQTLSELTAIHRQIHDLYDQQQDLKLRDHLTVIQRDLDQLAVNLRHIIDDLHPQALDLLGLESALQSLLRKRTQFEGAPKHYLRIEHDATAALNRLHIIHIYRIVSEAVANILRHARCRQFEVVLIKQNGSVSLTIEDDGVGLPTDKKSLQSGRGLLNINMRAKVLQTSANWSKSRFHQGTRLSVHIPIEAQT